jgi:hypothetical protein
MNHTSKFNLKQQALIIFIAGMLALTVAGCNQPGSPAASEKSDCTVIQDDAAYFVEATEKTIKLKKGTLINVLSWEMHQGLYAVKARINGEWVRGEIHYELISCPETK